MASNGYCEICNKPAICMIAEIKEVDPTIAEDGTVYRTHKLINSRYSCEQHKEEMEVQYNGRKP